MLAGISLTELFPKAIIIGLLILATFFLAVLGVRYEESARDHILKIFKNNCDDRKKGEKRELIALIDTKEKTPQQIHQELSRAIESHEMEQFDSIEDVTDQQGQGVIITKRG